MEDGKWKLEKRKEKTVKRERYKVQSQTEVMKLASGVV